jgi:hypothetical protein
MNELMENIRCNYRGAAKESDSWSDWISYEGNPVAVGDEKEQSKA